MAANNFGIELRIISNLLVRKIQSNALEKGYFIPANPNCDNKKMTPMQGMFIGYIAEHQNEDVFQKDLEKQFTIRRSTATEILKLMEQNGLITKETVKGDARLKRIVLTDLAKKNHEDFVKNIDEVEQMVVKDFTEDEVKLLMGMLEKIKKNLE